MIGKLAGAVVDDAVVGWNLGAEDCLDLRVGCGAMQAGGDEDGDAFFGNACGMQPLEQWRQRNAIGSGAGDVAHGDGSGALACREFDQRLACDGVVQRRAKCCLNVREGTGGAAFDEVIVRPIGQGNHQTSFAKGECCLHVGSTPRGRL